VTGSAASVLERADALAAFTEVQGEITRPYGTAALLGALAEVGAWAAAAGLSVRRDVAGSTIGRRGPEGLPTLLIGSHVDSVRDAGRYDGPLGVLVALAALERLADKELPYAVELVAFADEEGLRFKASYLASRVFAGIFDEAELEIVSDDGARLADAIRAMGGDPDGLAVAAPVAEPLLGYVEVHIEQGPVLQAEDLPIGIVTAIAGQSRGFVDVIGEAGHAGNTPPHLRRDALCGASELVLAVEQSMRDEPGLIATVGKVEVAPNVGNVIPGLAMLSYDIRHQDDAVRDAAVERLQWGAAEICDRRGLSHEWRHLQDHPAVPMSPRLRGLLARGVESVGVKPFEMPSGAGHDAVSMAHLADVGMLFVRCRDGISHHPAESVREDDVAVAIDVTESFLWLLADEVRSV
jgi:allantoate deiminase